MIDIFIGIGIFTIITMVGFVIIVITDAIKELTRKLTLKYKQKHRFDKSTTAKCYCVDCIYHDNKTGRCYCLEDRNTVDWWFCGNATPRKKEAEQE